MSNRLSTQISPYLQQHAENPVDWYPWGEEALQKARQENKPIFLSIGYAACHWCHVMAHESFEDPETAALMNRDFVCIKVDREERPDLDHIYMKAVVALTGQGGWPMSVFLTPEGKPFYGGTYYPPVPRYNMPSFQQVLTGIAQTWANNRDQVEQNSRQLTLHLQNSFALNSGATLDAQLLDNAVAQLENAYDWQHGGWGAAPKFPQPMAVDFLLRQATRNGQSEPKAALHALRTMARGGMYDVVGGGFHRYSTDADWLIPHFEKMLYDNALLASAYLHAYLVSKDEALKEVCEQTLAFIQRELSHPAGGFFSSLDADSEGEEGKYYVWTMDEIREILNDESDFAFFSAAYDLIQSGNFEGKIILQRRQNNQNLAAQFDVSEDQARQRLHILHQKLLTARAQRIRPGLDDKVLTAWNGLALQAFAEAGRYLDNPQYTQIAIQNADFLLTKLVDHGQLKRIWRDEQAQQDAFLEDYAALSGALLSLYQSDSNPRWFVAAQEFAKTMLKHFANPEGGFFDTPDQHESLIARPASIQDNATPSGNALAAHALLQLSAFTGNGNWHQIASDMISGLQNAVSQHPAAFSYWLCAADLVLGPAFEVAIIGDSAQPETHRLIQQGLWGQFHPRLVAAIASLPLAAGHPPLLEERPQLDGTPTAYVCQNFTCQQPVTTPEDLRRQLAETDD